MLVMMSSTMVQVYTVTYNCHGVHGGLHTGSIVFGAGRICDADGKIDLFHDVWGGLASGCRLHCDTFRDVWDMLTS